MKRTLYCLFVVFILLIATFGVVQASSQSMIGFCDDMCWEYLNKEPWQICHPEYAQQCYCPYPGPPYEVVSCAAYCDGICD